MDSPDKATPVEATVKRKKPAPAPAPLQESDKIPQVEESKKDGKPGVKDNEKRLSQGTDPPANAKRVSHGAAPTYVKPNPGGGGEAAASENEQVSSSQQPPPPPPRREGSQESVTKEVRSKRSSKLDTNSSGSKHVHKVSMSGSGPSIWRRFLSLFDPNCNYFGRMFRIPLVRDPIAYCRAEDFTPAGDRIYNINEQDNEQNLNMIEAACNYSESTRAIFDRILQERKESALSKKTMSASLDFSRLAPWNESMLDRLQCIFQIFDASGDGSVDLNEMTNMMIEYGDKSTPEDRKIVFDSADILGKGALNFKDFVTMLHTVTVKSPDVTLSTVVDTFRQIDRNMARIRGLDVVQQLQSGLF